MRSFRTNWKLKWLVLLGACAVVALCLAGCDASAESGSTTQIFPSNGARSTTVHVVITTSNILAGTTLDVSGNGISIANVVVDPTTSENSGRITADFIISAGADLNARTVTIIRPNGAGSSTGTFTVLPVGSTSLTLTKITPSLALQGETIPVTITGVGFLAGDLVSITGTGITVTINSIASSVINATFVISATASVAPRKVTVTRSSGLVSNSLDFRVDAPLSIGATRGTIVFASNLATIPGGPVNLFSSIYTGRFSSQYNNLTMASVSMEPDSHPRFSPDRTAIVFIRSSNSTDSGSSVYLMDHDGRNLRKVTPVGDHGERFERYSNWPSFHPDGRHILFTNGLEFSRMAIMDLDGSHARFIFPAATANFSIYEPIYSPVGRNIVFSSTQDGPAHIYVINDDGTNLQRLTNSSDADRHPGFTYPRGGFIFYERDHYDNAGNSTRNIYSMRFDGTGNKALTTDGKSFDPGTSDLSGYILFVSDSSGNDEIYTVQSVGSIIDRKTSINIGGAVINDPSTAP